MPTVPFLGSYGDISGSGLMFRNKLINGDMRIDQRNNGSAVTVNGTADFYGLDRWAASGQSADGVFTVQQSSVAPAGFSRSLLCTVTTADSSIGATQRYFVEQKIEGFNISDLAWGTSSAKPVTLSFWVRSSVTGNLGATVSNGSNRYYPFSYSISAANTWEYKTVTIPGETSGVWNSTNTLGMEVLFSLGTGYTGTANTWGSSVALAPTGSVNVISTNGATFYITGVQLEAGSVASPFEQKFIGTELSMCMRYYQKFQSIPCIPMPGSSNTFSLFIKFNTPMRIGTNAMMSVALADANYATSPSGNQWGTGNGGVAYQPKTGTISWNNFDFVTENEAFLTNTGATFGPNAVTLKALGTSGIFANAEI